MELRSDVIKVLEYKDNCIYKTRIIKSIWLPCHPYTVEEENKIANKHGGDFLASTGDWRQ